MVREKSLRVDWPSRNGYALRARGMFNIIQKDLVSPGHTFPAIFQLLAFISCVQHAFCSGAHNSFCPETNNITREGTSIATWRMLRFAKIGIVSPRLCGFIDSDRTNAGRRPTYSQRCLFSPLFSARWTSISSSSMKPSTWHYTIRVLYAFLSVSFRPSPPQARTIYPRIRAFLYRHRGISVNRSPPRRVYVRSCACVYLLLLLLYVYSCVYRGATVYYYTAAIIYYMLSDGEWNGFFSCPAHQRPFWPGPKRRITTPMYIHDVYTRV